MYPRFREFVGKVQLAVWLDPDHNIGDGACTTAMAQSMENENATCETLNLGCRIPSSFPSEKIGHIVRLEEAVLIHEVSMEYRTLYSSLHNKSCPVRRRTPSGMRRFLHYFALAPRPPIPTRLRDSKSEG